jgi:hypothetical protein
MCTVGMGCDSQKGLSSWPLFPPGTDFQTSPPFLLGLRVGEGLELAKDGLSDTSLPEVAEGRWKCHRPQCVSLFVPLGGLHA